VWALDKKRFGIQAAAALLQNANFKGFFTGRIYTGGLKSVCVPGLNCYSCPGAAGACPLGSLQNALAVSGKRAPPVMPNKPPFADMYSWIHYSIFIHFFKFKFDNSSPSRHSPHRTLRQTHQVI